MELQIAGRGIEDEAVLRAMREVPREVFVPPEFRQLAYMDRPLPIGVHVAVRDGTLGWPENAPYDAIIVTAGGSGQVPPPLKEQLAPGGRLIIPHGMTRYGQDLVRIRCSSDGESFQEEQLGAVRFVQLIGEAGWAPEGDADAASRSRALNARSH